MNTPKFEPQNKDFAARTKENFKKQVIMKTLEVEMTALAAGHVELSFPYLPNFTQQHGFLHAGTVTTVMDSAAGYAGFTLMGAKDEVLSIEFKANFLNPAIGERFRVTGDVIKSGRTITVAEAKTFAQKDGEERLVATLMVTLIAARGRGNLPES
ncbi:MAG: PaaI family thioesterase [Halocynthiibacter sp.]